MNHTTQVEQIMEAIHHECIYGNPTFAPEQLQEKIEVILFQVRKEAVEENNERENVIAQVSGFLYGISGELDDRRKEIAKNYAKALGFEALSSSKKGETT